MPHKISKKIVAVSLMSALLGAGAFAEEKNSHMLETAREAATYAGAAQFCKVDEDLIDEYIAKAEAAVRVQATDDYERMLGQIEFKNIMTAASAKEPVGGCDAFIKTFEDAVRKLR